MFDKIRDIVEKVNTFMDANWKKVAIGAGILVMVYLIGFYNA